MGKDMKSDGLISDDDFFAFQRAQQGMARRAIQEHARDIALRRPLELRAELADAVREAARLDAANDSARLPELHVKIKSLKAALKTADAEHAKFNR